MAGGGGQHAATGVTSLPLTPRPLVKGTQTSGGGGGGVGGRRGRRGRPWSSSTSGWKTTLFTEDHTARIDRAAAAAAAASIRRNQGSTGRIRLTTAAGGGAHRWHTVSINRAASAAPINTLLLVLKLVNGGACGTHRYGHRLTAAVLLLQLRMLVVVGVWVLSQRWRLAEGRPHR